MNDYIINPSVFYWMNVLGTLQTLTAIVGGFSCTAAIVFLILCLCEDQDAKDNREWDSKAGKYIRITNAEGLETAAKYRKMAIVFAVISIIFILVAVFIPGKQTCIEMLVARTATFDNVQMTVDGVKDLIDYIVGAINSIK